MARRSAGEGTVFQTPNGRWVAQLELPRRQTGKRRRVRRRAPTKREAQDLLRELQAEYNRTGGVATGRRTIEDATGDYLLARQAKPISGGTGDHDRWLAGLLVEGLGGVRLDDLSVRDCDEYLVRCAQGLNGTRRPVGRRQIGRVRRFLINVLTNEIRLGHLRNNVAQASEVPVTHDSLLYADDDYDESAERRAIGVDELHALIDHASGARLILADLTGRNGLRPGEARSLRWADLDLDAGELSVTGQQDRANRRTRTKRRVRNAARTIGLDEMTIERLRTWNDDQQLLKAKAGPLWIDLDVVATTARGTQIDRHSWARSVRQLCSAVGIDPPIDPYELRHTAISLQADAGRSSFEIADWAGTSEEMISRVYRHRLKRVADLRPDGW